MAKKLLTIGCREDDLAIAQARFVINAIHAYNAEIEIKLITMRANEEGLVAKRLERELSRGKLDLCVHDLKNLPIFENPKLPIVAVSKREDARDVLLLPKGVVMLSSEAVIGCHSAAVKSQLERLYPRNSVQLLLGDTLSLLAKMDAGQTGALVLSASGLKRLGLEKRISRYLPIMELLPSPCQGAVAVQGRWMEDVSYLEYFHDADSYDATFSERCFVRAMGKNCMASMAAYAVASGNLLELRGMFIGKNGKIHKGMGKGLRALALQIGVELAVRLQEQANQADKQG